MTLPDDSASSAPTTNPSRSHDPFAAFRRRDFRLFLAGNVAAMVGMQMQLATVGWEIFERTHDAWMLGLVGLVQFLPVIAFTLPAGQVVDHFPRKRVIMAASSCMALCSLGLAASSANHAPIWTMYACLLFTGVARTFQQPAKASLLPQIVPRRRFGNAVTWNTGAFQLASIVGPGLAGVLIAASVGFAAVYVLDAVASLVFVASLSFVKDPPMPEERPLPSFDTLVAGVGFVWRTKIILAAMTLDMLAVLLGGAVTLLPVFAGKDLLNVGAVGFGCMRAAPALGALIMMLWLAFRPPMLNAGASLLRAVAGFGVATIVFGFSRSYLLSLAMLFLIGAFDMVSVVVRHTLVQLLTPDEMRGRVSAVNSMFIGASNELGGFESGTVAYYFGPTASVVSGGIGTLATVLGVAWMWPQLGKYGRLDESVEIGPDITESESAMP